MTRATLLKGTRGESSPVIDFLAKTVFGLTLAPRTRRTSEGRSLVADSAAAERFRRTYRACSFDGACATRSATTHDAPNSNRRGSDRSCVCCAPRRSNPCPSRGWDLALLYPSSALRPYKDIDFIVRDDEARRAKSVVTVGDTSGTIVDFLHGEISRFESIGWEDVLGRGTTLQNHGSK